MSTSGRPPISYHRLASYPGQPSSHGASSSGGLGSSPAATRSHMLLRIIQSTMPLLLACIICSLLTYTFLHGRQPHASSSMQTAEALEALVSTGAWRQLPGGHSELVVRIEGLDALQVATTARLLDKATGRKGGAGLVGQSGAGELVIMGVEDQQQQQQSQPQQQQQQQQQKTPRQQQRLADPVQEEAAAAAAAKLTARAVAAAKEKKEQEQKSKAQRAIGAASSTPFGLTGRMRVALVNHAPYHLEVVAGWLHVLNQLPVEVIWYQVGQGSKGKLSAEGLLEATVSVGRWERV